MDTLSSSVSDRLDPFITCPGKRPSTGQRLLSFRAAARVRSISLYRQEPVTHSDSMLLSDHPRSSGKLIHFGFQFEVPTGVQNDRQEEVTFDVVSAQTAKFERTFLASGRPTNSRRIFP